MALKKSNRSVKASSQHTQIKSIDETTNHDSPARPNTDLMNPEPRERQFPQFCELSYDIRAMIWEEILATQRILRVSLEKRETSTRNKYQRKKVTKAKNKKSSKAEVETDLDTVPEKPYRVVVEERYAISKLFHVCSESRHAAETFYRVKVPCTYRWGKKTQDGTFYFRPEFDNIQVGVSEYFSDFAFNLWQLDPRYVGLINITLPWQPNHQKVMEMEDKEKDVLRGILLRLQNVSFAHMLLKPRAPPPSDPRKLGNDHTRPYFSFKNLIHAALGWFRLLEALEAVHEHEAVSWVQSQRKNFKARAVSEGLEHGEWVQPAMGFWLYPIGCVKSFVNDDGTLKTAKDVLDGVELEEIMSSCVPELCLSRLA
ncbi:hypothetical protein NXS19_010898 [Fusarium pseudograminearum]|nr:hypothetical protein NXS19_010898 [Fusarium pseudograminearum]